MYSQEFFARFLRVAELAAIAPSISEKVLRKANGTAGEINKESPGSEGRAPSTTKIVINAPDTPSTGAEPPWL
jgi:hypothetical protein